MLDMMDGKWTWEVESREHSKKCPMPTFTFLLFVFEHVSHFILKYFKHQGGNLWATNVQLQLTRKTKMWEWVNTPPEKGKKKNMSVGVGQ